MEIHVHIYSHGSFLLLSLQLFQQVIKNTLVVHKSCVTGPNILSLFNVVFSTQIWFQNKRARWRRRANDSMNNYPQPFLPVPPMLSPVTPYGFMPTGHIMTSSSTQYLPGYINYPWMQGPTCSNINQQLQLSNNQMHCRLQPTNQNVNFQNQHYPINSTTPSSLAMSSAMYDPRTAAQQVTSHHNRHPFQ